MIKTEFYTTRKDGVNLYRTYSNQHVRIQCEQNGAVYDEAINVENNNYTYIETTEPIDDPEDPEHALQAVHILLGQ